MPVNLVSEDELRDALRPYRADPDAFEAGVRERLEGMAKEQDEDPLAGLSPLLRSAAALVPLPLITGGKISAAAAAKLAPATGVYKLLGYLALPAVSLLMLLVVAVLSFTKIRGFKKQVDAAPTDQQVVWQAVKKWWARNAVGACLVYVAILALPFFGAGWLLFPVYIVSFGLLLYVLSAYARLGLGNRGLIGQACATALLLLNGLHGPGDEAIHFVDQSVIGAVLFGGALVVLFQMLGSIFFDRQFQERLPKWVRFGLLPAILVFACVAMFPAIRLQISPVLWPTTPAQIKGYVESADIAPHHRNRWQNWDIVARWAVENHLDPDLSGARRVLAEELAGKPDAVILGYASRLGLMSREELDQPELAKACEFERQMLLTRPRLAVVPVPNQQDAFIDLRVINSLDTKEWVIRAAVLRGDLTSEERGYLEERLHVTFDGLFGDDKKFLKLEDILLPIRMLDVIQRPIKPDQYRDRVHNCLLKFFSQAGGGFQPAGGFKTYLNLNVGSPEPTEYAVELMEVFGAPADLDLNWVRSYAKPSFLRHHSDERWIAAVTRDRLRHVPGATGPTWLEVMYCERSLLAAMLMVAVCIFATASAPKPRPAPAAATSAWKLSDGDVKFPWVPIALILSIAVAVILITLIAPHMLRSKPKRFEPTVPAPQAIAPKDVPLQHRRDRPNRPIEQ